MLYYPTVKGKRKWEKANIMNIFYNNQTPSEFEYDSIKPSKIILSCKECETVLVATDTDLHSTVIESYNNGVCPRCHSPNLKFHFFRM